MSSKLPFHRSKLFGMAIIVAGSACAADLEESGNARSRALELPAQPRPVEGNPAEAEPPEPTPAQEVPTGQEVYDELSELCAGCHSDLFFEPDLTGLIRSPASGPAGSPCDVLIEPGHPERSALYMRLVGSECGTPMPIQWGGSGPIEEPSDDPAVTAAAERLRAWIAAGAPL